MTSPKNVSTSRGRSRLNRGSATKKKGGSIASDAVLSHVPPSAYTNATNRFSAKEGGGRKKATTGGSIASDRVMGFARTHASSVTNPACSGGGASPSSSSSRRRRQRAGSPASERVMGYLAKSLQLQQKSQGGGKNVNTNTNTKANSLEKNKNAAYARRQKANDKPGSNSGNKSRTARITSTNNNVGRQQQSPREAQQQQQQQHKRNNGSSAAAQGDEKNVTKKNSNTGSKRQSSGNRSDSSSPARAPAPRPLKLERAPPTKKQTQAKKSGGGGGKDGKGGQRGGGGSDLDNLFVSSRFSSPSDLSSSVPKAGSGLESMTGRSIINSQPATMQPRNYDTWQFPNDTLQPFSIHDTPLTGPAKADFSSLPSAQPYVYHL